MINRRRLGRTELMVTELGFGAMNLRGTGSFEKAYEITNKVLDAGINIIDTARAYKGECEGLILESERVVGDVIRGRTDLTEPIVIITKGHGYTIEALHSHLSESREALGITGTHDLRIGDNKVVLVYFLHGLKSDRWEIVSSSGVLDELNKIKEQGLVNFVGFSSHYPDAKEIKAAIDTGIFDVTELPYNVFNRGLGEDGEIDLLKYAFDNDVGIVNMKAFDGNGMVSAFPILKGFMNIDYPKMLNFCFSNPYIATVDAGIRFNNELDMDLAVAKSPRLNKIEIASLKKEADKVFGLTKNLCRECTHCNEKFECPQKIDFMGVLSLHSRFSLSQRFGKDSASFSAQYKSLEKSGRDCTECGECLQWCEYKLNIPKMLKNAENEMR